MSSIVLVIVCNWIGRCMGCWLICWFFNWFCSCCWKMCLFMVFSCGLKVVWCRLRWFIVKECFSYVWVIFMMRCLSCFCWKVCDRCYIILMYDLGYFLGLKWVLVLSVVMDGIIFVYVIYVCDLCRKFEFMNVLIVDDEFLVWECLVWLVG